MMDWTDDLNSSFYINGLCFSENPCRLYVAAHFRLLQLSRRDRVNAGPNAGWRGRNTHAEFPGDLAQKP